MQKKIQYKPREEATERIEGYIERNGLSSHAKLPSERDMCEMWDMNRTTLRSAIKTLIAEGKLYNKIGSGTFVAEAKLTRNLQDMFPFSQLAANSGKSLTTKVLSERLMECNKKLSAKLRVPLGHKLLELIRLRVLDDTPVLIETCYIDCVRYQGIDRFDFAHESLYAILEKEYGTLVVEGQEQLALTYATREESELLEIEDGAPLFHLAGTAGGADGAPIEYFESVLRVDKMHFASVLRRGKKKV